MVARVLPQVLAPAPEAGPGQRRHRTLQQLAGGLPEGCTVYHDAAWTRVEEGGASHGRIDFAVVAPSGRTVLIEQRSGFLVETPAGGVASHRPGTDRVASGIARAAEALRARFAAAHPGIDWPLEVLFHCPDHAVRQPAALGLDPARIVDASRRESLAAVVAAILQPSGPPAPLAPRVHRFFRDLLDLVPEIGAIADEVESLCTRLSGGLARWARRIDCDPFRLRVRGTAGSGKTQLALAAFRDAVAAGRRPLYVCYNRPLADHMAALVPPGGEVGTYHQLCERALRRRGRVPDFSRPDAFEQMEAGFAGAEPLVEEGIDELIVDEGQDFEPAWRDPLLARLQPGARAWWLEDPAQNLYGRESVALPGWVSLTAAENWRSPGDVMAWLGRLLPDLACEAASPVSESGIELLRYSDPDEVAEATRRAITQAVGLGFRRDMIGVISFHGRGRSALAGRERLGPYRLRSPTGGYDLLGNPELTAGDVLLDSVYRFKGRSAPCVVFTEIDFETLDPISARKLFVGATRASMKLLLVASARAAPLLGL